MKFCMKIRVYVQIYICRAIRFIRKFLFLFFFFCAWEFRKWGLSEGKKRMHRGKELCILCKKKIKKKFISRILFCRKKRKMITRKSLSCSKYFMRYGSTCPEKNLFLTIEDNRWKNKKVIKNKYYLIFIHRNVNFDNYF